MSNMALQTSYSQTPATAFIGQLANGFSIKEAAKNEDTVSIPFGSPVVFKPSGATSDIDVCLPANSSDNLKGILFRTDGYEPAWTDSQGTHGQLDSVGLIVGTLMDIARAGLVYVTCITGCVPGDRAFVSYAVGGAYTAKGQFGNVTQASTTIDETTKGEWKSTAAAGAGAWLEFNCVAK